METILIILSSINKISLVSFFITLVVLIYQIYLFKKERSKKKNKINIPEFSEKTFDLSRNTLLIDKKQKEKSIIYPPFFMNKIFVTSILLLILFSLLVFNFIKTRSEQSDILTNQSTQENQVVVSGKIKIYNMNWEEITEDEIKSIRPGTKIIVAIEKIDNSDIDMARIKINQGEWDAQSITTNFNKEKNVFFREYQVATNDSFLKIEAQLHSKSDGWLGD